MANVLDNTHCDRIKCDRLATKRVLTSGMHQMGMRGTLCCDDHAQMLLADGERKGREWLALDYPQQRRSA